MEQRRLCLGHMMILLRTRPRADHHATFMLQMKWVSLQCIMCNYQTFIEVLENVPGNAGEKEEEKEF